jgi:hypothetical protein
MMARIAHFNVMVRSSKAVHVLRRLIAKQFAQSMSNCELRDIP